MINVKNIVKAFDGDPNPTPVIDKMSFEVMEGEFVSIIGPSGSGKTTLIKIIGDLLDPTAGTVSINGESSRSARLQKMFSFVFQNPVLLPWRTVLNNIKLPLEVVQLEGRDPADLLEMVGLEGAGHKFPKELSGGMAQRVALARGLTFNPKILLMDEPFSAVDEFNRHSLNDQLIRLWQEIKVTILFITHSISEAVYLSDRVFVLSGRPACVEHILKVPFPRPRDRSIRESAEFQEIVKCLRARLE